MASLTGSIHTTTAPFSMFRQFRYGTCPRWLCFAYVTDLSDVCAVLYRSSHQPTCTIEVPNLGQIDQLLTSPEPRRRLHTLIFGAFSFYELDEQLLSCNYDVVYLSADDDAGIFSEGSLAEGPSGRSRDFIHTSGGLLVRYKLDGVMCDQLMNCRYVGMFRVVEAAG